MAVSTSSASQDVMSVAIFVASLLANPVAGHPRFIAVVRATSAAVHFKKAKACDPSRTPTSTEKATTVASYRLALSSSPCSAGSTSSTMGVVQGESGRVSEHRQAQAFTDKRQYKLKSLVKSRQR